MVGQFFCVSGSDKNVFKYYVVVPLMNFVFVARCFEFRSCWPTMMMVNSLLVEYVPS
jgi:hypothetical protein